MYIRSFPLLRPGVIGSDYRIIRTDKIIVKPDLLSICAADMRYYLGMRPVEVLRKKLPMVLIHEAIGTVLKDNQGELLPGSKVVLLPCGINAGINSNYQKNAYFRSSNADGFCQEALNLDRSEVVLIDKNKNTDIFVLTELLSVCFQGCRQIESLLKTEINIGIWGDGALAYLMALLINLKYPYCKTTIIGKHENKLEIFNFADNVETIYSRTLTDFDLCIECVGGRGAEQAIDDIINSIRPRGTILLSGVSEQPPCINTRKVLEKGLIIRGTTRSIREDFVQATKLIESIDEKCLVVLFSNIINVRNEIEISNAFEISKSSQFKTMLRLSI